MKFIKRINNFRLIKVVLGIAIFSIGYLLTMFYFQMKELEQVKQNIVLYNAGIVSILHLESDFEREINETQNLNISKVRFDENYISNFFKKNNELVSSKTTTTQIYKKTKTLFNNYFYIKNQSVNKKNSIEKKKFRKFNL